MKTLILGASGATGRLVVSQLVERKIQIKLVVRAESTVLNTYEDNTLVEIIRGNIDEFDINKMTNLLSNCSTVVCCLGHNISLKGIYGPPHKLVYNLVKKICTVAESSKSPKRFILMSTTAYTNKSIGEMLKGKDAFIFSLLKAFLPPHKDNMLSGDYLVKQLGPDANLQWVAVRPDTLMNKTEVEDYEIFETIQRNPLSDPGHTSRIQVAHFISDLIEDDNIWQMWVYKTPVIYSKE
jgi:nucleoside-diphosphate-sugar epimerase